MSKLCQQSSTQLSEPVGPYQSQIEREDGPSMPAELIDEVVSYLRDDPATLRKLGIVSKAWLFSTRGILFSEITFEQDGQNRLYKFLNLVTAPSTSLSGYVTALQFIQTTWDPSLEQPSLGQSDQINSALPNIHAIHFTKLNFANIPPSIKVILAGLRPEKVVFDAVIFPTQPALHALFTWIPEAAQVALHNITSGEEALLTREFIASQDPNTMPTVHPRRLNFSDVDTQSLRLLSYAYPGALPNKGVNAFHIQPHDWIKDPASMSNTNLDIANFIQQNGPSLQHLSFDLSIPNPGTIISGPGDAFYDALDFSKSSRLRTAYIGVMEWEYDSEDLFRVVAAEHLASRFIDILVQIPSLEQVTIDFRPCPHNTPPRTGVSYIGSPGNSWRQMLDKLSESSTKRICLRILVNKRSMEGYVQAIRSGFLLFGNQGPIIAKVVCLEDVCQIQTSRYTYHRSKLFETAKQVLTQTRGWIEDIEPDKSAILKHLTEKLKTLDMLGDLVDDMFESLLQLQYAAALNMILQQATELLQMVQPEQQ